MRDIADIVECATISPSINKKIFQFVDIELIS